MLATFQFKIFYLLLKIAKIKKYKTDFTYFLYGRKTLPLMQRGTWIGVSENRVLRRIFGCKKAGVIGGSTKLHNEKLHNLYESPNI
jgi:hypothetical protein